MSESRISPDLQFTVAICTLNRRKYVEKAVDEVLRQLDNFRNSRLVVVDNNSTDGTFQHLSQIAAANPKLSIVLETSQGEYYARAKAIEQATGNFLIFLDDDAVPLGGWLEGMLSVLLSAPDVGAVGCEIEPIWEGLRPTWLSDRLLREVSIYDVHSSEIAATFPCFPCGTSLGIRLNNCAQLYVSDERRNDYPFGRKGTIGDGAIYQILGGADSDLCELYARNGYRVLFTNLARVAHVIPESRLVPDFYLKKFASEGALRIRLSRVTGRRAVNRYSWKILAFYPAFALLRWLSPILPREHKLLVDAYYLKCLGGWQELLWGERLKLLPYHAAGLTVGKVGSDATSREGGEAIT